MQKIRLRALFFTLFMLLMLNASAIADEINIKYVRFEEGSSFIELPQIEGLSDGEIQERINTSIAEDSGYQGFKAIYDSLTVGDETGLQLKAEAQILDGFSDHGLLAIKMTAAGRIGPGRPGYRVTALMYDLLNGERISAGDIFKDIDRASAALDERVQEYIEPEMSDYLTPDELYPIPMDNLLADETGITFYYDQSRFNTLSDRSGAINFHYEELMDLLDLDQGSVLTGLEAAMNIGEIQTAVETAASLGILPGLPIHINQKIEDVLLDFPPLYDSEAFPTGERYQLEDARFRGSWLITDGEYVTGILSHRLNFFGINTGRTIRQEAADTLGESQSSIVLDENAALSYNLSEGLLNGYLFGENVLYLNFDSNDVLRAIWLNQPV